MWVGGAEAGLAGGDHPRSVPRVERPSRRGTTVEVNVYKLNQHSENVSVTNCLF